MDGNGRWARSRGLPRWRGHLGGVESVRDVVRAAPDLGITTLTLYAFSSDNWKRPAAEVGRLFWLLREYCTRERGELLENGVRVTAIGRRDRIPRSALAELVRTETETAGESRLHLRLAIDYSSKAEIARASRELAQRAETGSLAAGEISPDLLYQTLTGGVAAPDLLIRTAGEQRLSDFLLWELAYAELYFTTVLWPDFRRADLMRALADFRRRERRFGGLGARPASPPELVPANEPKRRAV
ncbi:MAG: di-trans,poly-cis-decaprenylcistransferase [Gemmatimonadetes bacterium]|nr:di-trans,poly-cis-decaprenylcistransferase [Gemmatimonadota bacterium]